jgi:hypothetical protein
LAPPFAERLNVVPVQIGPLLVALARDGTALTATEVVYTVDGAQPEAAEPLVTTSE